MASHNQKALRERFRKALEDKISSKGGIWISGEYINGKSVIRVRCEHGHEWDTRVLNIQTDRWCPVCAKRKAAQAKRLYADIKIAKRHRKKINKQIRDIRSGRVAAIRHREQINAEIKRIKQNEQCRLRYALKYRNDTQFRLNERIKGQFRKCLIKDRSMGKYYELLGYTTEDLRNHLESLFVNGMSWDNMGAWHIDHVRPKSWDTLLHDDGSVDEDAVKQCWALKNLQPLWAEDNLAKRNYFEG